ncbi:hypothetical protein OUZ56_008280 [Daphnia magna]|uniref:Uncharacterized protein n=1 Tax=Daphnia magna TaxID=35525 RepID=A0ABR0ACI0_9CRUS|nr:hypothetical protein OUZ56_008280 [Daphnia magna]
MRYSGILTHRCASARLPPGNASIFCDGAREGAVAVGKVPSGAGGTRRVYMVVGGWAVKRDKKRKKKDALSFRFLELTRKRSIPTASFNLPTNIQWGR